MGSIRRFGSNDYISNRNKKNENPLGTAASGVGGGYDSDDSEDYDYNDGSGSSSSNNSNSNNNGRSFGDAVEDEDNEMRFIEVWDYVGGTSFRGFIVDKDEARGRVEKTLFLFFEHIAGTQLKHGLMALIELATECFACDRLVICLQRNAEGLRGLVRDLGWVGFELITLAHWVQTEIPRHGAAGGPAVRCGSFSSVSTSSSAFSDDEITSEKWLFMGMEL